MDIASKGARDRNCQKLNANDGAKSVAVAGIVGATLEDGVDIWDVIVIELDLGTPEFPLSAPVVLAPLGVIGEAVCKAVKSCVPIAAALSDEAW